MNRVEIRAALVTHLKVLLDRWQSEGRPMKCEMENTGDIDLINAPELFMCFHIDWYGATQINIAEKPDTRYYGDAVIVLFGKIGAGTVSRLSLEDEIAEHFQFKVLSGVHVREATPGAAPGRSAKHPEWHAMTVMFPFFADSNA
jgi:hypothetical protein